MTRAGFILFSRAVAAFSCAIALVMSVLFIFPVPVYALTIDAGNWDELVAAYTDHINSGCAIRLTRDIVKGDPAEYFFAPNAEITIDTNGHSLTVQNGRLTLGRNVRLNGANHDAVPLVADGDAVNSGTVSITGAAIETQANVAAVKVKSNGRLAVSSGQIKSRGTGVEVEAGGSFVMGGGTISTNGIGAVGLVVRENGAATFGGNAQINATGDSPGGIIAYGRIEIGGQYATVTANGNGGSCGLAVEATGTAQINGGSIKGISTDVLSYGIRNKGKLTMSGGAVQGSYAGSRVAGNATFDLSGGSITGGTCGMIIEDNGNVSISGGSIAGDWMGMSVDGRLRLYGGTVQGHNQGIIFKEHSDAILYKGTVLADAAGHHTLYMNVPPANPKVVIYSALNWDNVIYKTVLHTRVSSRESFRVVAPAAVSLTEGQNKTVDFVIKGENPDGGKISLSDYLGAGNLSNCSYSVAGNAISFVPSHPGDATITIDDTITYNGRTELPVFVAASAPEPEPETVQEQEPETETEPETAQEQEQEPEETGKTVLQFYIDRTESYVTGAGLSSSRIQSMDAAPVIREGRTLLPIRYVAEPLGAGVSWDPEAQKATVTLGTITVELWIGGNKGRVNGSLVPVDPLNPAVVPITVPPGRTMLPLRFIAEALGCQVDWNEPAREVKVTYPRD
jgi:hypothetical protein